MRNTNPFICILRKLARWSGSVLRDYWPFFAFVPVFVILVGLLFLCALPPQAQASVILQLFSSSAPGLVPQSGGGTANFMRADGTWAVPPGGVATFPGAGIANSTGSAWGTSYTATTLTAFLNLFSSSLQGLTPASGGGTTNFLRADGNWAAPPGSATGTVTSVVCGTGLTGGTITTSGTCALDANVQVRSFGAGFDGGGSALSSGKTSYVTVPFGCTITGYNITADTGTVSFDLWKIATGTAIPTVGNSILTGGFLALSSGTALHSTSTALFTGTTVTAFDIVGVNIQAVSSATAVSLVIACNAT